MRVGDKTYAGDNVPDGIFDSLNQLKAQEMNPELPQYKEARSTYAHIMKLVEGGRKMPLLSFSDGERLLKAIRPNVLDFFSITSLHFLHLGSEGVLHFVFLLNSIISEINVADGEELNSVWANVLHKGHGKDPEHDRSWRTISCCPMVAKAMDMYMVELNDGGWYAAQATTQFQGKNSSHDLAALSITEAISHGLHVNKEPVFVY